MLRNHVFLLPLLLLLGSQVLAERPSDQSICDYYASQRFGGNNSTTQLRLMQGIVAYAYAGGSTVPFAEENSTGIFNPGRFNDRDVFLRPWFNGSKATTNLNDHAVGVDWLDGGGTAPLIAFLNGSTATAEIKSGTNQDTLFSHWYVAFGKIYGCSRVKNFLENTFTPLTPAYVHKYMDLNQTHIGYFIDQLITASKYYGFSDTDAATLSTYMNARYNTRCSPPIDGQLYSICLAKDCPLAAPNAQCDVYPNVQPYGVQGSGAPSGTEAPILPTTPASSGSVSTPAASGSSSSLSGGAIAGISIGATVVVLLAAGMFLFFRRQQQAKVERVPAISQTGDGASYAFPPPSIDRSNLDDGCYSRATTRERLDGRVDFGGTSKH
ncbi:hypothetical protein HRG_011588 [Hirsutella rhossiliensis]